MNKVSLGQRNIKRNVSDDQISIASSPTFSYFSIAPSEHGHNYGFTSILSCMKSSLKWKASLLSKRNKMAKPQLEEEDIIFLTENTHYSREEITEWFREFLMDCPEGIISKSKVKEMMNSILPDANGDIIANLIFTTFDKDNNGSLDFCEFIIALHCTGNSSPEDKLHWVFQMYDIDSSGSITIGELITVFATLYENEGLDKKLAIVRAEHIFINLDVNNDGDISEEEFVKGCMEDEELVAVLKNERIDAPLIRNISACSTPTGMISIEDIENTRHCL